MIVYRGIDVRSELCILIPSYMAIIFNLLQTHFLLYIAFVIECYYYYYYDYYYYHNHHHHHHHQWRN